MPRTLRLALLLSIGSIAGCGASRSAPVDAATGIDATVADAGGSDAGRDAAAPDAGSDAGGLDAAADAGPSDAGSSDAGPRPDAGPGPDAAVCDEGLGAMCEGTPCPSGLECNLGRCVPQARPICGGFVGAPCDDPSHPYCLYFSSADFGTCVTPSEAACLCARAPGSFSSCP